MRKVWQCPSISAEWGEPSDIALWAEMKVHFDNKDYHFFTPKLTPLVGDEKIFESFASSLRAAKMDALKGGLRAWDNYLKQPQVRTLESEVLRSRSLTERAFFLDLDYQEGRPQEYALYRDFVWRLDDDLRFGRDEETLLIRLQSAWGRGTLVAEADSQRAPIPESIRHEVWRRDQGKCCRCGSRERLEFDHIVPVVMGGSNTARNIELLCEDCNRRKGPSLGVIR